MTDLFDTVIEAADADRPAFRQAPAGHYLVSVREAKRRVAATGNSGIQLDFTMLEALDLDVDDLEGVDLAKVRLSDTLYITEASEQYTREKLQRITPDVVKSTYADALEILPGNEVVVKVIQETTDRNGATLRTPRLKITSYYTVKWFYENRLNRAA